MKAPFAILLFYFLITGTRGLDWASSHSRDMDASAHVLKTRFNKGERIEVQLYGSFRTTGACSPQPQHGLLRKKGQTWDTLITLYGQAQMDCGLPTWGYSGEKHTVGIPDASGIYKLLYYSTDMNRQVLTEAFEVR